MRANCNTAIALALLIAPFLASNAIAADESSAQHDSQAEAKAIDAVLARYLESVSRIESYDVTLAGTSTAPLKIVFVEVDDPARPERTITRQWGQLGTGERPVVHTSVLRQIWTRAGRERMEAVRSHGPPREMLAVDDGRTLRTLSNTAGETSGSVRNSGSPILTLAESYATYFGGKLADHVRVLRNLGEHSGMRLLASENGATEKETAAIVLPLSETQEYHVWFNARHGQLPSKVELWREEPTDVGPVLLTRMEVARFHEAAAGIWVPVVVSHTMYCTDAGELLGRPTSVVEMIVDVEKSHWNAPVDESLFVLKFAPGTQVLDQIDELQLVVGEGDDGRSVEFLVQNAKEKRKVEPPQVRKRFDLAKVRPQDAAVAKLLLNYDAILSLDETGAVTHVVFDPLQAAKDRGGYAPVIDNALLPKIAQLEKLEYLGLNHTQVTDEGLKQLAGLKQLKRLSLQGTRISDEGLKNLEPLASLEGLWLDNTLMSDGKPVKSVSLTDAGLAHLAKLPNLTHLYITNTDVTDAGLAHLKSLTRLEQVSLKGTAVTADGIAATKAAMPGLQRME